MKGWQEKMSKKEYKLLSKQSVWSGLSPEDAEMSKLLYGGFCEQFLEAGSLLSILMLDRQETGNPFLFRKKRHEVEGIDINKLLRDTQVLWAHFVQEHMPQLFKGLAAIGDGTGPGLKAFSELTPQLGRLETPEQIYIAKTLRSATEGDYVTAMASLVMGQSLTGVDVQNYYDVVDKRAAAKIPRRELHTDAPEDYFMLFCNRGSSEAVQSMTMFHDMLGAFKALPTPEKRLLLDATFQPDSVARARVEGADTKGFSPFVMTDRGPRLNTAQKITYTMRSDDAAAQQVFKELCEIAKSPEFTRGVILEPGDMVAVSADRYAHSVEKIMRKGAEGGEDREPRWLVRMGGRQSEQTRILVKKEGEFFPDPRGISMEKTLEDIRTLNRIVSQRRDDLTRG
jgi:hypothetical protein